MEMSRATNIWALWLKKNRLMSVVERWFRTYVMDTLESVNDLKIEQVPANRHNEMLKISTEMYEDCG